MKIEFLPEAKVELDEAVEYYELQVECCPIYDKKNSNISNSMVSYSSKYTKMYYA